MKAILINGILRYQSEYNFIYNVDGNKISTIGATDEQWAGWGFKDVIELEPTETQILGGWVETATEITRVLIDKTPEAIAEELASKKVNLVREYERDTDALIQAVVGERAHEYLLAEQEALAFKAAGYPVDNVPMSVSTDAGANKRDVKVACDDILLMADNWRVAQAALRGARLTAKADTKAATTLAEVNIAEATWKTFIGGLRASIIE